MATYEINIEFETRVERTNRVMEVAEAFGIGLSDSRFIVYDGLKVDIDQGDVVYITGQSGSGKSLALRDIARQMSEAGLKVASIDEVELQDRPLIEQIGATMAEATQILARAGISDAYLYVRKPSELSDGQRYRLRLAKLIQSDAKVWVADEFGAVLDRVTARAVAYNVARVARAQGVTLMVATTHTDLVEELAPNVKILKHYRERVKVECDREAGR